MEGHEKIVVFVDYIGDNRVRSGQPCLPDYRCIRKSMLCCCFLYKITRKVWTC